MTKLIFRYGTINSSKTANLIMTAHSYYSQNKQIFIIKPSYGTRFNIIKSKAFKFGINADLLIDPETSDISEYIKKYDELRCILVDECHFLSAKNVDALRNINIDISIICYGLRTDYHSMLYPGSKRLMEIADTIEEIETMCFFCCINKAIVNAKYYVIENQNFIIKNDENDYNELQLFDVSANEKYHSICWKCWNKV